VLALGIEDGRESIARACGKGRFDAANPVQRDLLPESGVPQLFVDGARSALRLAMAEVVRQAFENLRGRCCRSVVADDLFQFPHRGFSRIAFRQTHAINAAAVSRRWGS
jgi:hypothetical protein